MESIVHDILDFSRERKWFIYHNLKNVSTALLVEAAELVSALNRGDTAEALYETADVASYFILLCYHGGLHPDLIDELMDFDPSSREQEAQDLAVEILDICSRIAEVYQWKTPTLQIGAESFTKKFDGLFIAAFFSLLTSLADKLGGSLNETLRKKMVKNREKYQVTNQPFRKYNEQTETVSVVEPLHSSARPREWDRWQQELYHLIPSETTLKQILLFEFSENVSWERVYLLNGTNVEKSIVPLCQIPHPHAIFSMDMFNAISDRKLQSIIFDTLKNGHRLVGMGPVLTYVNKQFDQNVFGPTIDTLLLNKGLLSFLDERGAKVGKAVEVGTGSGFVAKSLVLHAQELDYLNVTDLHMEVIDVAKRNIWPVIRPEFKSRLSFTVCPLSLYNIATSSLDLIISNPPYVPITHSKVMPTDAIHGLELYDWLLGEQGARVLRDDGSLLLTLSSVSHYLVDQIMREKGFFRIERILAEKMVPFNLIEIQLDEQQTSQLLEDEGLIQRSGILYHRVYIYEFKKK
ncbi:MAG: methyltransferase [Victivallales bacterium]|nr:methyltransferase [Victivallales bacterium]